jgi:hypothetical protein
MPWRSVCAVVLSFGLISVSCKKDSGPVKPDPNTPFPYAAPGAATMTMDLSDLAQGTPLGPEGLCHAVSALAVAWANVNVVARLAVPVAAIDACVHTTPVYLGTDTWRWTASGGSGTGAWTAELRGQKTGQNRITWTMDVSGTPQHLDRFSWFDGEADTQARSGVWHFYDPASPLSSRELVRSAWSLPEEPGASKLITFENTEPGSQGLGDRLGYALAETQASVSLLDASTQTTTTVEWNLLTGEGRAISAQADTCCWGARPLFQDLPCR